MKKLFVGLLVTALLSLSMAVNVVAEIDEAMIGMPYAEQVIGTGVSYIEAVWFDIGVGHEAAPGTGETGIRPYELTQTQAGGSGRVGNIGWTAAGEWVQYTVTVEEAGTYSFYAYISSGATPPGQIEVAVNDEVIGITESTFSSGWGDFRWIYVGTAELPQGEIVLTVTFPTGAANFAALRVLTEAGVAEAAAEAVAAQLNALVTRAAAAVGRAEQAVGRADGFAAQVEEAVAPAADTQSALERARAAYIAVVAARNAGDLEAAEIAAAQADAEATAANNFALEGSRAVQGGTPRADAPGASAEAPAPGVDTNDNGGLPIVAIVAGVGAVVVIAGIVVFMKSRG